MERISIGNKILEEQSESCSDGTEFHFRGFRSREKAGRGGEDLVESGGWHVRKENFNHVWWWRSVPGLAGSRAHVTVVPTKQNKRVIFWPPRVRGPVSQSGRGCSTPPRSKRDPRRARWNAPNVIKPRVDSRGGLKTCETPLRRTGWNRVSCSTPFHHPLLPLALLYTR